MIQKLLFLIALLPLFCIGQETAKSSKNHINYKDITEIDGLIYFKTDTTLVTGKVIRYNRKNVAKKYVLVSKGKPDVIGWVYYNDNTVKPKNSVLGEVLSAGAFITGAVMTVSGNDVNLPIKSDRHNTILKEYISEQKNYTSIAYSDMQEKDAISSNLNSQKEFVNNDEIKVKEYRGDINFKDITEIYGLIHTIADSSLVSGKVIRYNRKNEVTSYILVVNGVPDKSGWKELYKSEYIPQFNPLFKKINSSTNESQLDPYDEATRKEYNYIIDKNLLEEKHKDKIYDNKELKISSSKIDDKKDGLYQEYYDNGQLRSKGYYIKGKKDGFWEEYHENGNLERNVKIKKEKKEGLLENYYFDGQLKGRINYKEGKEDGIMEVYYENGQLMMKGLYKDALQIGEWKYYNEKGILIKTETYKN